MDCYGLFCTAENITLPDGTYFDFNRNDAASIVRDLTDTARKYINDEYADYLKMFLKCALSDQALKEKQFDSDCEYIESENEEYRDALNEIESILQQYETKVFDAKKKLMRKDLDAMLKAVHGLINEVI